MRGEARRREERTGHKTRETIEGRRGQEERGEEGGGEDRGEGRRGGGGEGNAQRQGVSSANFCPFGHHT